MHYLLTSSETIREAHYQFFHLTDEQITFLPVSHEADQALLHCNQPVIRLRCTCWATAKICFLESLHTWDKTPGAPSWCNSKGCSRDLEHLMSLQQTEGFSLPVQILHMAAWRASLQPSLLWLGTPARQMASRWLRYLSHHPVQAARELMWGQQLLAREACKGLLSRRWALATRTYSQVLTLKIQFKWTQDVRVYTDIVAEMQYHTVRGIPLLTLGFPVWNQSLCPCTILISGANRLLT